MKSVATLAGAYLLVTKVVAPLAKAAYLLAVAFLIHLPLAGLRLLHGIRFQRYFVPAPVPVKVVPRSKHSGRPLRSTLDHAKDLPQ